jgi:hypothetical protein
VGVNGEVDNVAETAEVIQRQVAYGPLGLGLVVGLAAGATGGYFFAKRRLETKYNQIAADEIAEMREHYQSKLVALENTQTKPTVDEVVKERGYSVESQSPPMAVTPPETVVDAAKESTEDTPPPQQNVFQKPPVTPEEVGMPLVQDEWDAHKERSQRSPLRPYIIHRDERSEQQAYDEVTLTFYEADDVLCNESDEVIADDERERMIGEANLEKFGHGSGDATIVYIRNDQLECDFEVIRSPNSYAEEVHGFEPDPPELRHSHHRRDKTFDDD